MAPTDIAKLAGLAAAIVLAGCGGGSDDESRKTPAAPARVPSIFAYDADAPLRVRRGRALNPGYPIPIRELSFTSPLGGGVDAYLGVPPVKRPRPAIIYLHGAGGDRQQLAVPAAWMAARGAVVLTISAPVRQASDEVSALAELRRERDLVVRTVVELRRAIDVLQSLPQVDDRRIGFVGFSAGARSGAILAGVDRRIRAYVLMSGGAAPVSEYVAAAPPELRNDVRRLLGAVDPLRYVRRARPAALLLQNGREDAVVPRAALTGLARAASKPKLVRWYSAGHDLNDQAFRDQLRWLSARLGLAGPVVRGAATGP